MTQESKTFDPRRRSIPIPVVYGIVTTLTVAAFWVSKCITEARHEIIDLRKEIVSLKTEISGLKTEFQMREAYFWAVADQQNYAAQMRQLNGGAIEVPSIAEIIRDRPVTNP